MKTLDDFPAAINVKGRLSIADLFVSKSKSRCGIYLLGFDDGTFYIGLSVTVVSRFSQHRKKWGEISTFSFIPMKAEFLAAEERSLIFQAERHGMIIRNVEHVSFPAGDTDLDDILSPDEQDLAVNDPGQFRDEDVQVAASRSKEHSDRFRQKFDKFVRHPWHDELRDLAKAYIVNCIPAFRRTEYSFWLISCMPSTNASTAPRLFCFNLNAMETFVAGFTKETPTSPWAFVNVSKSTILEGYRNIVAFKRAYPCITVQETAYRAAGHDVISFFFDSIDDASNALADPIVARACRVLNLGLMRKGASLYTRYHCFPLVDDILGRVNRIN